jgi:heme-degrading monooxygenase HmoA
MTKSLQTVFGSQQFLNTLISKVPQPAYLLKPSASTHNFMLLDMSGQGQFSVPIRFTVARTTGTIEYGEFIQFMYFYITKDQETLFTNGMDKIFNAKDHFPGIGNITLGRAQSERIQYVLITSWERSTDFFKLKETPAFEPMRKYMDRAAQTGGYHETGYKVLAPHEYLD